MKKLNKNIVLFIMVALFIATGYFSGLFIETVVSSVKSLCLGIVTANSKTIPDFITQIDGLSKTLLYHNQLLDLNSLKDNLLGTKVVEKDETTIVKAKSGRLLGYIDAEPYSDEELQKMVSDIVKTKDIATNNNAKFLYCSVAPKNAYEVFPSNIIEYNTLNQHRLLTELSLNAVPILDSMKVFDKTNMNGSDIFFKTDHHWTPLAGFYLTGSICQKLNDLYDFEYNPDYIDQQNYNIKTFDNWFLGSYGKQTGTFFSDFFVDNFDLITPVFPISFIEEIPATSIVRTGDFEETMIHKEHLVKDYYGTNTYISYSGGDFRLQKITNCNNPNGAKIVVIRHSFGCVVTPFLAIHAKELHVIDDRDGSYPSGEKIDIEEYVCSIKPDYVIILK